MKSTGFQPDFWGFPPNNPVSVAPQPSVLSLVVKEVLFLSFTEGTTVWEPNFASISLFHSRSFSLPTRFPSLFCFGVYHTVVGRPVCQPGCGWLAFGGLWSGPSGTRSGRLRAYLSLSPLRRWPALVPLSSNLSIQHSTNNFVTRTCWFGSPMPLGRDVVFYKLLLFPTKFRPINSLFTTPGNGGVFGHDKQSAPAFVFGGKNPPL